MDNTILGGAVQEQNDSHGISPLWVQSLWYHNQIIKLDGWAFKSCRFDNCVLVIETPNFALDSCYIDPSTQVEVHGMLINAAKLISIRDTGLRPTWNPDGTVSIGV